MLRSTNLNFATGFGLISINGTTALLSVPSPTSDTNNNTSEDQSPTLLEKINDLYDNNSNQVKFESMYTWYSKEEEYTDKNGARINTCSHQKNGQGYSCKEVNTSNNNILDTSRIENEIDLLKTMDHPNVQKFQEAFRKKAEGSGSRQRMAGTHLVSDWLPPNMKQLEMDPRPTHIMPKVPDYAKASIAFQILSAISYLHGRKVMHCDLTREKIVLAAIKTKDLLVYTPTVVGFGSAQQLQTPHETEVPEDTARSPCSQKSDMLAFGIIVFEMLTPGLVHHIQVRLKRSPCEDQAAKSLRDYLDTVPSGRMSGLGRTFLERLFQRAEDRPTAEQALEDAWFKDLSGSDEARQKNENTRSRELVSASIDFMNRLNLAPEDLKLAQLTPFLMAREGNIQDIDHNDRIVVTAFQNIDKNKDGTLSRGEFDKFLPPTAKDTGFGSFDFDNNNKIGWTEFVATANAPWFWQSDDDDDDDDDDDSDKWHRHIRAEMKSPRLRAILSQWLQLSDNYSAQIDDGLDFVKIMKFAKGFEQELFFTPVVNNQEKSWTEKTTEGSDAREHNEENSHYIELKPVKTAAPSPLDFATKVDRIDDIYRIGRRLGKGASGEVFKCTHIQSGQVRACKKLRSSLKTEELESEIDVMKKLGLIKELESEIDVMKKMDHPNIAKLIEVIKTADDHYYLISEICSGTDLQNAFMGDDAGNNKTTFTEDEIKSLLSEILSAVSYMHTMHGAIHRDLKLGNVMILEFKDSTANNSVSKTRYSAKVIDFGASLQIDVKYISTPMLDRGPLRGSRFYLSPELYRDRKYCAKCDVWSVGVMAMHMLGVTVSKDKTKHTDFMCRDLNDESVKKQGKNSHVDFEEDPVVLDGTKALDFLECEGVSPEARNFVSELLKVPEDSRPTAATALRLPWLDLKDTESKSDDDPKSSGIEDGATLNMEKMKQQLFRRVKGNEWGVHKSQIGTPTSEHETPLSWIVKVMLFLAAHEMADEALGYEVRAVFQHLDTDRDGLLIPEEFDKFGAPEADSEFFGFVDLDGDNKIGWTEFTTAFAVMERIREMPSSEKDALIESLLSFLKQQSRSPDLNENRTAIINVKKLKDKFCLRNGRCFESFNNYKGARPEESPREPKRPLVVVDTQATREQFETELIISHPKSTLFRAETFSNPKSEDRSSLSFLFNGQDSTWSLLEASAGKSRNITRTRLIPGEPTSPELQLLLGIPLRIQLDAKDLVEKLSKLVKEDKEEKMGERQPCKDNEVGVWKRREEHLYCIELFSAEDFRQMIEQQMTERQKSRKLHQQTERLLPSVSVHARVFSNNSDSENKSGKPLSFFFDGPKSQWWLYRGPPKEGGAGDSVTRLQQDSSLELSDTCKIDVGYFAQTLNALYAGGQPFDSEKSPRERNLLHKHVKCKDREVGLWRRSQERPLLVDGLLYCIPCLSDEMDPHRNSVTENVHGPRNGTSNLEKFLFNVKDANTSEDQISLAFLYSERESSWSLLEGPADKNRNITVTRLIPGKLEEASQKLQLPLGIPLGIGFDAKDLVTKLNGIVKEDEENTMKEPCKDNEVGVWKRSEEHLYCIELFSAADFKKMIEEQKSQEFHQQTEPLWPSASVRATVFSNNADSANNSGEPLSFLFHVPESQWWVYKGAIEEGGAGDSVTRLKKRSNLKLSETCTVAVDSNYFRFTLRFLQREGLGLDQLLWDRKLYYYLDSECQENEMGLQREGRWGLFCIPCRPDVAVPVRSASKISDIQSKLVFDVKDGNNSKKESSLAFRLGFNWPNKRPSWFLSTTPVAQGQESAGTRLPLDQADQETLKQQLGIPLGIGFDAEYLATELSAIVEEDKQKTRQKRRSCKDNEVGVSRKGEEHLYCIELFSAADFKQMIGQQMTGKQQDDPLLPSVSVHARVFSDKSDSGKESNLLSFLFHGPESQWWLYKEATKTNAADDSVTVTRLQRESSLELSATCTIDVDDFAQTLQSLYVYHDGQSQTLKKSPLKTKLFHKHLRCGSEEVGLWRISQKILYCIPCQKIPGMSEEKHTPRRNLLGRMLPGAFLDKRRDDTVETSVAIPIQKETLSGGIHQRKDDSESGSSWEGGNGSDQSSYQDDRHPNVEMNKHQHTVPESEFGVTPTDSETLSQDAKSTNTQYPNMELSVELITIKGKRVNTPIDSNRPNPLDPLKEAAIELLEHCEPDQIDLLFENHNQVKLQSDEEVMLAFQQLQATEIVIAAKVTAVCIAAPNLLKEVNDIYDHKNSEPNNTEDKRFTQIYSTKWPQVLGPGETPIEREGDFCWHQKSNQHYSWKTFTLKQHSESDQKRITIEDEIDILKKMDHPNILKFQEAFRNPKDSGTTYLVSEDIQSTTTLAEFTKVHGLKLSEKQVQSIAFQILSAMYYLHGKGITLGNLDAASIMITEVNDFDRKNLNHIPKVTDFGFAQSFNRHNKSETPPRQGVDPHTRPEATDSYASSEKSDLNLFGKLVFKLLAPDMGNPDESDLKNGQLPDGTIISLGAREFLEKLFGLEDDSLSYSTAAGALKDDWFKESEASKERRLERARTHVSASIASRNSLQASMMEMPSAAKSLDLAQLALFLMARESNISDIDDAVGTVAAFHTIDENKDGSLSRDEFGQVFPDLDPESNLDEKFNAFDLDENGSIGWTEFVATSNAEAFAKEQWGKTEKNNDMGAWRKHIQKEMTQILKSETLRKSLPPRFQLLAEADEDSAVTASVEAAVEAAVSFLNEYAKSLSKPDGQS